MNPHQVTKDFERELCAYTGAPYAVAVSSCTAAIMLAVAWHLHRVGRMSHIVYPGGVMLDRHIEIPKRTYVSVPMAIMHAGGWPTFRDDEWLGAYQLKPLPVYDSARWFCGGMYHMWLGPRYTISDGEASTVGEAVRFGPGSFVCVSFHASKTLGLEQGGCILHDNPEADAWFRRARFDGRTEGVAPKDDTFPMVGWHCYMNPSTAAQGILKLHSLPRHNAPLPNDDYPSLDQLEIFR